MEDRFLFYAGIIAVVVMALAAVLGWMDRRSPPGKKSVRRGTGNALLGLQQFIEPSAEYVVQAQNTEQKEEEDDQGLGGDEEAVRSDLEDALGREPIDPEEVRRHLAGALRMGLDWRALFDQAVADELRKWPFRAPFVPPARRVAPRE
jgi:hypothetical protein